jgi:hypothetical protein
MRQLIQLLLVSVLPIQVGSAGADLNPKYLFSTSLRPIWLESSQSLIALALEDGSVQIFDTSGTKLHSSDVDLKPGDRVALSVEDSIFTLFKNRSNIGGKRLLDESVIIFV